jgi:hypothetical protein
MGPILYIVFPIPVVVAVEAAEISEVFRCTWEKDILSQHSVMKKPRSRPEPMLNVLGIVNKVLAGKSNLRM